MSQAISESEAFGGPDEAAQLRKPPHSIEAESSVLGGLMLDNNAWDRVGDLLTDSDFYRHEHRLIYVAIGQLINANKPADVVTVHAQLQALGKNGEVGGLSYINSLAQYVPSAGNIRRYAEIVRQQSVLRRLISAADEIATNAFNPSGRPVETILDEAMQKVMNVSPDVANDDWVTMEDMIVAQLDTIQVLADAPDDERSRDFTPTGLPNWDEMLDGGTRAGQFIVVGARPSMGKTSIADVVSLHVTENPEDAVAKFSMEMENGEGAQRAISNVGSIPMHALRRPKRMTNLDWSNLSDAVGKLRRTNYYSTDRGGLNINQIRSKARQVKRRAEAKGQKLRLIVVDYFQLIEGVNPRQQRSEQLAEASRGLKSLAKELGCAVLALAQINRSVEGEGEAWEKQMPRFKDLKDCGSLEQDADIIMFLIRPSIAQKSLDDEWKPYARGDLAKQRGGRIGILHFLWEGSYTRYTAWPDSLALPTSMVVSRGGTRL